MRNKTALFSAMILSMTIMVGTTLDSTGVKAASVSATPSAPAATATVAPTTKPDASLVKTAYENFIKKTDASMTCNYINGYDFDNATDGAWKTVFKTFALKDFNYYTIQDINGDGVSELLLASTKTPYAEDQFVIVLTYKNGSVTPVFAVGGLRSGLFTAANNRICFGFGASDLINNVFLTLKDDALSYASSYTQVLAHTATGDVYTFKKDGKEATKTDFENAKKEIGSEIQFSSVIPGRTVVTPAPQISSTSKKKASKRWTVKINKVKLVLPKSWSKKSIRIKTGSRAISFYSKKNKKAGGMLCTVSYCKKSAWKSIRKNLPNYKKLGKRSNKIYYLVKPTDVQCVNKKAYIKLYNKQEKVVTQIKIK